MSDDETAAHIMRRDMSPGVIHTATSFEYSSALKRSELGCTINGEVAEVHCIVVLYKLDPECIETNKDKIGATSEGACGANFANNEETLTPTLDHASVLHGIGVTTVAFVYDMCDHDPVKKPNSLTAEAAGGGDTMKEVPIDRVMGTTANLGPSIGSLAEDVKVKTTVRSEENGKGYVKA